MPEWFSASREEKSEINGGITGSRNVMVQRKDPRRSVFSQGDKTNGSVWQQESGWPEIVFICVRARKVIPARLFVSVTQMMQLHVKSRMERSSYSMLHVAL